MTSSDEIADALVEHLNGVETSVAFTAENPQGVAVIEVAKDRGKVFVQPQDETETPLDRGDMADATRVVSVSLYAPSHVLTRAQGLKWLNEIKASFVEVSLAVGSESWRWIGNETVVLYDPDAMKEQALFFSEFRAGFRNYA